MSNLNYQRMEVLNRNQRRSAIWRITGMGVFALSLLVTSVFSMHQHYNRELNTVTVELKRQVQTLKGEKQGLVSKVAELETTMEAIKGSSTSNTAAQSLQQQLEECRSMLNIKQAEINSKEATIQSLEARMRSQSTE